jgi:hypothetical protein
MSEMTVIPRGLIYLFGMSVSVVREITLYLTFLLHFADLHLFPTTEL